jgi:penicillin-binding protein 2
MEQALALENGYLVPLAKVPEVQGNFNPVEVVSFEGMPPVQVAGASEEEAGDSGDNEPPPKRAPRAEQNVRVRAAVRPEADEEGSRNVRNQQEPAQRRPGLFKRLFGR